MPDQSFNHSSINSSITSSIKEPTSKRSHSWVWMSLALLFIFLFGMSVLFDFHQLLRSRHNEITEKDLEVAGKVVGIKYTDTELQLMHQDVVENLAIYQELRKHGLDNSVFPALNLNPLLSLATQTGNSGQMKRETIVFPDTPGLTIPENLEELAFAPVSVLSQLIRSRKVSSVALTEMYLKRLKKYDSTLQCVITLLEQTALKEAQRADEEIAAGKYRGPLHGIPYGIKDLLAVKGTKTTWGAKPYKDQILNMNATVVTRLQEAGAVLIAKLSLGALAWGEVWYGGTTKNPWNIKQGSSGSSAGPAAATAAGLVGFSIGTETRGSIVSPSTRCGVTGLRPTYGRVSRYGAMALSWSMDKIGPICRSVEDCAWVFNTIYGPDGQDFTLVTQPFIWDPSLDINTLRIGYLKKAFNTSYPNQVNDQQMLAVLRKMGVRLIPIELPDFPVNALSFILNAEAAAAFDELTRSGRDDLMVRQERYAWPNVFRQARLIPAVEYIQANRHRARLMQQMAELLKNIDVYIAPSFDEDNLLLTNLTGHPAVVVPNGFNDKGTPTSITFIGNLFEEAKMLRLAKAYQEATEFQHMYPNIDKQNNKK